MERIPEAHFGSNTTVVQCSTTAVLLLLLLLLLLKYSSKKKASLPLPPSPWALPIVGHLHLLSPLIHQSFHELSRSHGPLFRLKLGSVPCVVASTPDLAREFLKANELAFSSRKHSSAIKLITYDVAFAFAPYGPYWKFIKKLSTVELLGARNLGHFLPIRTGEIRRFLSFLAEKSSSNDPVNLTEELVKLTNNVISQMMMSMRCSGSDRDADEAKNLVREVTQIFGQFNVSDFIWFCKNLDLQGFKKRYEDTHRRYDALLERIISRREQSRTERNMESNGNGEGKDFLDMLLDILEDDNAEVKITRNHIKALILDFFTAATDTTAIAIEWSLVELMNNPTALKKAQDEIDRAVGKDRVVQESDCPNLPYLQAIIKESLRLHPPIPMLIRKSIEDCTVQGYHIPSHTLLFVNIWSIGRNPQYWEEPLQFTPERFLHGGPLGQMDVKGQNFQLLPFGTGRRGCPGISLAMRELPTVVAAMLQCFDWKVMGLPDDNPITNTDERPGLTAPRALDLVCVPSARINSLDKILNP